jgi:hypothetical protein
VPERRGVPKKPAKSTVRKKQIKNEEKLKSHKF